MTATSLELREFPMSEAEFSRICTLARRYTGIVLGSHKRHMVYGRLVRRLRALNLGGFDEYLPLIAALNMPETNQFINAITTNLTSFFREEHHFNFLAQDLCRTWEQESPKGGRLRLWSAGCSSGEEAYSIAITLLENLNMSRWNARVLATDLDSRMLQQAANGLYEAEQLEALEQSRRKKWFTRHDAVSNQRQVRAVVRDVVCFKRLNLLESWPMKGPFNVIFCRNVMIYFDAETQYNLLRRFHSLLIPGGYLMVGHSESLHRDDLFESIGKTIYRKRCDDGIA